MANRYPLPKREELIEKLNHKEKLTSWELEAISWYLEMSTRDKRTGLANGRAYQERLQEEVEKAGSSKYCDDTVLVFIDLDSFKSANDEYGHSAGDQLLRATAAYLKRSVRSTDQIFRYAGDEFTMILPRNTNPDGVLERIVAGYRQNEQIRAIDVQGYVGIDIGYAFVDATTDAQELTRRADDACAHAKRNYKRDGAQTVQRWSPLIDYKAIRKELKVLASRS